MFEEKGNKCNGCEYVDVDIRAKNSLDREPCISCSRLYYDYYKQEDFIPKGKIKCIRCGRIVDLDKGYRKSNNRKFGICNKCFNQI